MKHKRPQLGSLSAQFFAYIQLKNKDIIRTGEIALALGLNLDPERMLLFRLADSGWIVRLKRGVYLAPPKIPAGGTYGPGAALIRERLMAVEQGHYQVCGPTTFQFYGFTEQISNTTYAYNDRISGSRTIGGLSFQFIKVTPHRLGGTQEVKLPEGKHVLYGSRIRTLVDTVYDWSRFHSLPQGYDWVRKHIGSDPKSAAAFIKCVIQYGNQATLRRLGYLLSTLGVSRRSLSRLKDALNDSKSLIPWVPSKTAKGPIDREWGVIING